MYPSIFNRCYVCHGEHTCCFNMIFVSMCEQEITCLHAYVSALIRNVLLEVLNKHQRGSLRLQPAVMTECQAEKPGTPIFCSSQEGLFLWVGIHIHGRCSGSLALNMPLWLKLICNNFIFFFFPLFWRNSVCIIVL